MNKTLLILKHEISTLINRFSFWFGVLGLPLIAFLILTGIAFINRSQGVEDGTPNPMEGVAQVFVEEEDSRPQGYIDQSGLIKAFPEGFDRDQLIAYTSEQEARQDLDAGTISSFYIVPPDYLESGKVTVYTEEFNLIRSEDRSEVLAYVLAYNLLEGDQTLLDAIQVPIMDLKRESIAPPEASLQRDREGMAYFFIPYAVMMLFYVAIMGSSGMLLNSVAKEKENRVMEVLLLSAKPHELLLGKVLGLGIVGLFQVVIWIVSSLGLLAFSGQQFNLPENVSLPPTIILWGIIFFVLGYLIYATLMAGVGALVPNLREASQATMVVIIPLMAPLFLISALIESPNSPLSVGLSLFPFTAPTTMMLRLSAAQVPIWQPLLAIALLIITSYLVVRAVAGMFRAQTILSGQPFRTKRFFLALLGK